MSKPSGRPIILCGFMSCGKSTLGKQLAKKINYEFYDTDNMIVNKYGMSIPEIFAQKGENYFREIEYETAKAVSRMTNAVIATGGGMLTFDRNGRILSESGIIIYIDKSFENCYSYISNDKNRPLAANRSKEDLKALYDSRLPLYKKYAAYTIDNNTGIEDGINSILKIIT